MTNKLQPAKGALLGLILSVVFWGLVVVFWKG